MGVDRREVPVREKRTGREECIRDKSQQEGACSPELVKSQDRRGQDPLFPFMEI